MDGPTTEVLNDDIRILRDEVHRTDLDVRELGTQVKVIIATVIVLGLFTLASLLSGVWWGASLTAKVDGLGTRLDRLETRGDRLEAKVDLLGTRFEKLEERVDARFDRLEASIARLLEQSKPAVKP